MGSPRLVRRLWLSSLALAVVGTGCPDGGSLVQLSPPILLVNLDEVDFGEVPIGFRVSRELTLVNGGDLPLEVTGIVSSDSVFEVLQGVDGPIEAAQEVVVRIAFAPSVTAGPRMGELTISSNASNAPDKAVAVRGVGVPPTQCGDCNTPPPPSCLSRFDSATYAESGTCVMNECEYTATVTECATECDPTTGLCRGEVPDAGVADAAAADAEPQDSLPSDTGADPDAGGAHAEPVDTGAQPDAGTPDTGPVDTGPACADAGITDSGLGAPQAVFVSPGAHSFSVPGNVNSVMIRAWGGGGQGGNQSGASGGGGAFVQADLTVTSGESLEILVAEGGGATGRALGNGAGASYVRRAGAELVVAAGGGGGGSDGNSGRSMSGGAGGAGGPAGQAGGHGVGAIPPYCTQVTGGTGGTTTAPGTGGNAMGSSPNLCPGQPGARNVGGRATGSNGNCATQPGANLWMSGGGQGNGGGGGGGSGYYGGGGSGFIWTYCGAGGGGGASWTDPGAANVVQEGGQGALPGRATEGYGAGRGGDRCLGGAGAPPCTCNPGGNGRVEIYY